MRSTSRKPPKAPHKPTLLYPTKKMNKNHLPRITLPTRSPALSLCFLLLSSLLSATHLASYLHSTRTPHTHTRTFIHKANHQPPLFLINLQPLLYPNMHVRLCFIIGGKQSISRCLETHQKKSKSRRRISLQTPCRGRRDWYICVFHKTRANEEAACLMVLYMLLMFAIVPDLIL